MRCPPYEAPVHVTPQSLAESSSRDCDCRERPRCCGLDEQLPAIDEVRRNGAARIDAAPGAVFVNETNRHVANSVAEPSDSEQELAACVLTQSFRHLALLSGTYEELHSHVHRIVSLS
jgi:hypothetical protein